MNPQENKFSKIYHAYQYAKSHGIDTARPETWDEKYKKRMQELAGIIPTIEEEIKSLKKIIK
jgi:hypothetical protein